MSELKRHHINEVMDMHNLTRGEMGYSFVYYADDADKVIAEKDEEIYNIKYSRDEWAKACNQKDKEIAELKKKLMPCLNGDCILTCEVVEKYGKENAELKAKLENVQASMYCDVVDANMEVRRLKRALWLARANDASSFAGLFSTLSDIEDDETRTYWIFGNKRKIVFDGLKCRRMETAYKWFCIWDDVANKCLKKAEEYK